MLQIIKKVNTEKCANNTLSPICLEHTLIANMFSPHTLTHCPPSNPRPPPSKLHPATPYCLSLTYPPSRKNSLSFQKLQEIAPFFVVAMATTFNVPCLSFFFRNDKSKMDLNILGSINVKKYDHQVNIPKR